MPKIMVPIPEIDDQVIRPVVVSIVKQIMQNTRIAETANILYPGMEERIPLTNSTINKEGKDIAKFPHSNQISIDVEESIEEDSVLTRAVYSEEMPPLFLDNDLGILIKPVYIHTKVSLSLSARFTDRASAKRWSNEMRNKIAMSRTTLLHTASYSYTIPLACIGILQELHRLREAVEPYNEDFTTYWDNGKAPSVIELTNVGGITVRKGVKETQQRILGMFDFKEEPEKGGKDGDADAWTISFSYNFEYDKPAACVMEYPLMVHNQLLSQKYRPSREDMPSPRLEHKEQHFAKSLYYLNHFEAQKPIDKQFKLERGISIPDFDEFIPNMVVEGTWRVVTWLIGLTPNDQLDLINIKDLPKTGGMDPLIHKFLLESEVPFITEAHRSVFQLQVYEEGDLLHPKYYKVDKDYNLTATEALNLRKTYHVRLGVYWDWNQLDKAAQDRLRVNPEVVDRLICILFPHFCGLPHDTIGDKFIPRDEMERIIDTVTCNDHLLDKRMKTVQTLFIEALNEEDEIVKEDFYLFPN